VDATRGLAGAVVADNLFVVAGAATVSIINPAAASQALAIIKMVSGGVLGCVTPNVVTAALIGAGLWKIVGPYISIGDVASLTGNKLKNLSDSIGNYLKQQETMSKKAQQLKELNSLKSLHRELVKKIEDIKNNKESTQEQEAATLSTLTQEVKAPAPVDTVMNGGRKTKKRSMKKARKTRRGIRTPLFKY
jgi:triphosphoribosyl-dephospho-CoA synthetase